MHGFDFQTIHPNSQLVSADLDKVLGIEKNEGEVFLFAKVVLSVVQATNHTGGGRGDLAAVGVYFCADGGYFVGAMEFGLKFIIGVAFEEKEIGGMNSILCRETVLKIVIGCTTVARRGHRDAHAQITIGTKGVDGVSAANDVVSRT